MQKINITFKTTNAQSREINVPLPSEYRTLQFYKKEECSNPYPLYSDCATVGEITIKTEYFGAVTSTMIGDTVNTEYTVEAKSPGLPSVTYVLYSDGFRNKDDYIPPGLYIRYLTPVNDKGEPVNASRAGTELKAPLVSELFMLHDDYKMEGPYPCTYNQQTNCWRLVTSGIAKTEKITNGTVTFTPIQGGGSTGPTENLNNGQYKTKYTTGSQPAVNKIEALGEAVITAPEVLSDPFVTGILVPSFSGTPNQYYDPLTKIAITEYPESEVQCSNGECKLTDEQVTLKSGQQAIFYSDGPRIAGIEQKADYTVYGVNIETSLEPEYIITNEEGFTAMDTTVKYNILPAEYNAIIADIDLYQGEDWLSYVAVDKTQGQGTGTYIAGSLFDIDKQYSSEVVLNRGSDVEIRGDKINLPIGQFKMVTDDTERTTVHGSVTDGTAKIRLQLTVKNNQEAFNGLTWRIVDPQVIDPTPSTIQGTLMDGDNEVDSLPVVFNGDMAEAVYRAPESFVRWQTTEEDDDKDRPYRYLQPTLDISAYFQNMKDPLPKIALRRPPVVLVHGLWGCGNREGCSKTSKYVWKEFESEFNEKELYDVYSVNYYEEGQVNSIVEHASKLQFVIDDAISKLKKQFAATKVDIIAHSLGGLLTREYCQQNNTDCQNKIRRFITIATPHYGSELADLLLVYRDDRDRDGVAIFPDEPLCRETVEKFVTGGKVKLSKYTGSFGYTLKEPHPIGPFKSSENPEGSAIDDLATGRLPSFIQSSTSKGRWDQYSPLFITLSSHTISGTTPEGVDGYDLRIWGLWQFVLRRCGFTPENVFPDENDRIVRRWSQRGGLASGNTSIINETDHFTVKSWPDTIDRIKLLLDVSSDAGLFSK